MTRATLAQLAQAIRSARRDPGKGPLQSATPKELQAAIEALPRPDIRSRRRTNK